MEYRFFGMTVDGAEALAIEVGLFVVIFIWGITREYCTGWWDAFIGTFWIWVIITGVSGIWNF